MMETKTGKVAKRQAGKSIRVFFWLNFGKLIIDATKLIFASVVLGTVLKGDTSQSSLLVAGIIASAAGAIAGLILVTLNEEK